MARLKTHNNIDLLSPYSVSKAAGQNQATLINMYLEEEQGTALMSTAVGTKDPTKGKFKVIALPTFGLSVFCDTGAANVRAMYELNDLLYVVAGNKFYRVNSDATKTELGTLNTSSGFAKIVAITGGIDTNNQLFIIDGTNGYSYNTGTSTATFPIADVDFVQTITDITAQDDYIIGEQSGSISFILSNLADSKTWEALDFASKIRKADRLSALISFKGELWLLGTKTTEVWQNTGNVNFPFERRSDLFLELGCAAKRSVVIAADRLFLLGKSSVGGFGFLQVEGYSPTNIATKHIMNALSGLTSTTDCEGITYSKDGHEFIAWTFPTDNKTFVYDLSNSTWTVRSSYISSTYGRFLGSCAAFCYNKSLIGDYNSGKIYTQASSVYTENGVGIKRQIVSPYLYKDGLRIFLHRLLIEVQTNVGSNKTFTLEMSTDGGVTWESIDTYTIPTDETGQIYTSSLGSAYSFLFRITTTADVNFVVLGFSVDISFGEN